jgi:hypothetical protein
MASKLVTLGGAAVALLMVATFPLPTDARQGGGGGHGFGGGGHGFSGGGGRAFGGGHTGGMHMGRAHIGAPAHVVPRGAHFAHRSLLHDRRIHRRVFIAPAYGAYYYGDSCYWLRQNAVSTGSPYWWNQYYTCIYGSGY